MIKHLLLTIYLCAFCSFISVGKSSAQSTYYYYKQLGIKEGLSQSRVQTMLNDHKGYLWVGTGSGLNCYDRDHLKQYFHQSGDEHSLPSNDILFVVEDSLLNLWIGTKVGLCLYDRTNDCFQLPTIKGKKITFVASYVLVEDGIVFGAAGALYKYHYASKQWETLYWEESSDLYITFKKMLRYDDTHILINSQWYGIFLFDLKTKRLEKQKAFTEKNYNTVFIDSRQRLWTSAYGKGLYCYQNGQVLKHFTTSNSLLTCNAIMDITEKDNHLWIATDGGGINIISLDDFSFSNIQQQQEDVNSFPSNTLYRLYRDPADNIWVGSIRQGLIGIKSVYARSFRNVPLGNPYGLSNRTINRMAQDSDGMVWLGTDGGGINGFNPLTGIFRHFPSTESCKVVCMTEYSPNELLFYSFAEGLFIFDKQTGRIRPFILVNKEVNDRMCLSGFSVNVKRISDKKILFTGQQTYVYDLSEKKFELVASMGKDYERNSQLIIETKDTRTYLLDLKGICEYDSSTGHFQTIYKGEYVLNDGCIDKDGVFWLASVEGLLSYNPKTRKSRLIQTSLFNEATSVVADNQHRIWIGTSRALYVYDVQTENFIKLDEVDGVLPNEYLCRSTLISSTGHILLGGTTGMTLIDEKIHFDAELEHKIELLDVLTNGCSMLLNPNSSQAVESIKIPWDFSSLQLKVLLNEKDVFRKNMFRFRIEGLDNKFMQPHSNALNINHLPIGEYVITASYYTRMGEWSREQEVLYVIVSPPWWKTYWFYAGLCLLVGSIIFYVMYVIHRKRKARQKREIAKLKNKMYEEKISFLTNISHELRTPLTLVCAPLKRIINHEVEQEQVDSQLASIYKQAYQMKNIIDMVLDVRKLEEGKEMLHILFQPLNAWVRDVSSNFAGEFNAKGIQLAYELDDTIEEAPFDRNKCEFVLSNFLMNALKFSEPGTTVTLITHFSPDKKWVRVAVRDQGMGLKMVDSDALFSSFYQGEHGKGGSGIGLSYSKSIISLHKGNVGVINNEDQGVTFYFELPLFSIEYLSKKPLSSDDVVRNLPKEISDIDYSFLKNFSVMVVEDTSDLRNYLRDTLGNYFNRVYTAKNGKEGLEQVEVRLPDIIISDVMMPQMNGFEFCREVKSNLKISHIPFILLTAYHNSQNMYTGYKTGADAFLPKPFEVEGLLALIYNQLKLREQIKARYQDDKVVTTYKDMSFSNADETFLLKLNTLISENLSNPELDVAFLASNMCISRSLLFNKVKTLTGMGIIDYVNKLRIDKAVVLLTTSTMNITEISEVLGFSSLRYFSKVFKSIKGEIPSTFKKEFDKSNVTPPGE